MDLKRTIGSNDRRVEEHRAERVFFAAEEALDAAESRAVVEAALAHFFVVILDLGLERAARAQLIQRDVDKRALGPGCVCLQLEQHAARDVAPPTKRSAAFAVCTCDPECDRTRGARA